MLAPVYEIRLSKSLIISVSVSTMSTLFGPASPSDAGATETGRAVSADRCAVTTNRATRAAYVFKRMLDPGFASVML